MRKVRSATGTANTVTALEYAAASINEENIQAAIIKYCKVKKIMYLQTSRRGVTCHTCKKRVYGGDVQP